MNGEEKAYFDVKFAELKTRSDERWKAHEQRSQDLRDVIEVRFGRGDKKFDDLNEKLDGVKDDLANKPCMVHKEKHSSVRNELKIIWTLLLLSIGGMAGGFWWMLRLK